MSPNELVIDKKMMIERLSKNGSLMDMIMDWHRISQNKKIIQSPFFFPSYLNYEKYGNGVNRYLSEIAEYLKTTKLMQFDGCKDYIELNMVYTEGQEHPSLERLMRCIDGDQEVGCGFQGVVLLHIDEWCSQEYRLLDKRFLAVLQYLEERRSRLLIIFQTADDRYHELLEKQLQKKFNIRVVDSMPLSLEYMVDEIEKQLQSFGFHLTDEASHCIEDLAREFKDVKEIDSFQQMKLIIEDVIFEYLKSTNSKDMLITDQNFQYSIRKSKQVTSKNESVKLGFELGHYS